MPTLGTHFSDQESESVEQAARLSPEKKVSAYIAEAVRQRMKREGLLPGNKKAELMAAIDEVGVDAALDLLANRIR